MDGRENYICFEAIKTGNKNDPKKGNCRNSESQSIHFTTPMENATGFQIEGLERK